MKKHILIGKKIRARIRNIQTYSKNLEKCTNFTKDRGKNTNSVKKSQRNCKLRQRFADNVKTFQLGKIQENAMLARYTSSDAYFFIARTPAKVQFLYIYKYIIDKYLSKN